jgi:hypothetical protein
MTDVLTLTEESIPTLPAPEEGSNLKYRIFWDNKLAGFGVRVLSSGKRTYIVQYRNINGNYEQTTIGDVDEIELKRARSKYRRYRNTYRLHRIKIAAQKRKEQMKTKRDYNKPAPAFTIECGYVKEGVHFFKTKKENAKYCCQAHYHANYNRGYYDLSSAPTLITNAKINNSESVIHLPDQSKTKWVAPDEHTQSIALLQNQLDQLEAKFPEMIRKAVEQHIEQMFANLLNKLLK